MHIIIYTYILLYITSLLYFSSRTLHCTIIYNIFVCTYVRVIKRTHMHKISYTYYNRRT